MPLPMNPPQVLAIFQNIDGSESLRFEPGKITYQWQRLNPTRPSQDIPTALNAISQIASGLESWGVSFSDVAIITTLSTRLPSSPPLLSDDKGDALFAHAEDMQLRWSRKISLPSWGPGHCWQHLITNHVDYSDAIAPTLLHEQEINTLVERDAPLTRDAAAIASFFEDALKLMRQAQDLVARRFIIPLLHDASHT
jgi:hypothetical protein